MAPGAPPLRLTWLVELVDVMPGESLLEIGCGRGVAVDLVCERLVRDGRGDGQVVGLDRSESAVTAATDRNARWVDAGLASLVLGSVTELVGLPGAPFDAVFAMNVNLFWIRSPSEEIEEIRAALRPGGRLLLGWDAPSRAKEIADRVSCELRGAGLVPEVVRHPTYDALLAVVTRV